MTHYLSRSLFGLVVAVGLLAFAGGTALAAGMGAWKWKGEAEAELAYDTNVYNFSSAQEARFDANSAGDQTSGRFNDMESVSDVILTPAFKATGKTRGLGGRAFEITPSIGYEAYLENTKKSHFELGLDLEHEVGSNGRLALELGYAPDVFKKNYLSNAVDANADGSISASERVYSAGTYDDAGAELKYSTRLFKRKKGAGALGPVERVDGELLAGIQTRKYDSPFTNRDEDSIRLGAGLDFELPHKLDLSTGYLFERVETPVSSEVLIRDEPDFGVDFNGDLDTADQNTRTVQTVDRSRNEHTFAVKAGMPLDKGWYGKARYDLRIQNYLSEETYDVTRVDRQDIRHRIGIGAEKKFAGRWSLELAWLYTHEEASREGVAGTDEDESKSYDKHLLSALLTYEL